MPPKGTVRKYKVTRMFAATVPTDGGGTRRVTVNNSNVNDVVPQMDKGARQAYLDKGSLVEFYVPAGEQPTPAAAAAKAANPKHEEE